MPRSTSRLLLATAGLLVALAGSAGCDKKPAAPPVVVPPLSAVIVTPATDTLVIGDSRTYVATALDTLGQPVSGVPFLWTSSDPAVATVTQQGRVTALSEGTTLVIAAAGGFQDTVLIAVSPGPGWRQQTSNATENLHGVFFAADGRRGWAVGETGVVLRTTNAGATWIRDVPAGIWNLRSVWFEGANGCAVGDAGTILLTDDSGVTWARHTAVPTADDLLDVTFADADTGWAVGANGTILRTVNGGTTWTRVLPTRTLVTLQSVSFFGRDGWAVGDNGVILGTHDSGASWFVALPSVTSQSLHAVSRASSDRAIAVGVGGVTPRTVLSDSVRWELRNAGLGNQLEGVSVPGDSLVAYAVGFNAGGIALRTDDGGVTWTPQTVPSTVRLHDVFFVDAQRGWAVGEQGRIVHTATGGR